MDECKAGFVGSDSFWMDDLMTIPRVSVFMPVYNGQQYLKEAIESVLSQTFAQFEFIILNDGSKDASKEIIDSYKDARIRRIENLLPSGLMAVRNQGLKAAGGEYIATIDCDDVWDAKKLEKQVEYMDAHPAFAFVGSRAAYIDEKSQIKGIAWRYKLTPKSIPPFLLFGNYFIHSSILLRRSMIPKEGYQASTAEDYELWTRLGRSGLSWSLPHVLVKYRVHAGGDTYRQAVLTNRMQEQIRKIYISQLQKMGLEPTEEELDIHSAISSKATNSLNSLKLSAVWLLKIIEGNRKTHMYDESALRKVIVERWLMSCFAASKLGFFRVVRAYFSFNISKIFLAFASFCCLFSFLRYLKNKDLGRIE
jgi:glycosyltransferase involved in cell wall biosynthesis